MAQGPDLNVKWYWFELVKELRYVAKTAYLAK